MAGTQIPDPLKRRHLVEAEQSASQALALAESYLAEGHSLEAVAFLAKAEASDRLDELRQQALEAGDGFLLRAVAQASSKPPAPAEWAALARAAEAAGKDCYAADARRQAERGEKTLP